MKTSSPQLTGAPATRCQRYTPDLQPAPPRPREDADVLLKRLDWHVVRRLDGLLQGDYRSLFTGQGYDLAEVREYQPEDDVRYMDWNVTARMDAPYVRQYIEDREITAWLLLDLSPSVDFGTANFRKRDLVVDFAGVMARLLMRHGNRVGAMLFSNAVDEVLQPRNGQMHALRLLHQLVREDPQASPPSGRPTDLAAILDRAGRMLRRRALVFVVSDFISESGLGACARPAGAAQRGARGLAQRSARRGHARHRSACVGRRGDGSTGLRRHP